MRKYLTVWPAVMIFCALAALSARAAEEAGQAKKGEEALKGHVAKSDEDKALVAKLSPTYPLKTCVVSDQELGKMGKPIDYLYEGRLISILLPGLYQALRERRGQVPGDA